MTLPEAHPTSERLLALIDEVAHEHFGHTNLAAGDLVAAVARVSAVYTAERTRIPALGADREALCARLRFFLPRDFPKLTAPLLELARVGALPRGPSLRLLDLGAGLGTSTLGAASVLSAEGHRGSVLVDAVDRDPEALGLARALCERHGRELGLSLRVHTHVHDLGGPLPAALGGPYDVILLGFVLNELSGGALDPPGQHAARLGALASRLAPDGALVVLEPALREHSRALQATRGELIARGGPPFVFAPCLQRGACPLLERERDWCHQRLRLALPERLAAVASGAGLRESDLSFSYLTLCARDRSLAELSPGRALTRAVTAPLRSKGKLELGVCGAGPERRVRRLDRHAHAGNAALERADRGSVLELEGGELRGEVRALDAAARVRPL